MEYLTKNLLAKVNNLNVKSYYELMPYFTTEESGHGEMDYVQFLMQNDGNPPEGGTWTEQHITYGQLEALYNFCKENEGPDYLNFIRSIDKNVLLSFPNVEKSAVKREIKACETLRKNLKKEFHLNRPRFWEMESGDIVCQPDRRKSVFFCYSENFFGSYWFKETIMAGNTAVMVK